MNIMINAGMSVGDVPPPLSAAASHQIFAMPGFLRHLRFDKDACAQNPVQAPGFV